MRRAAISVVANVAEGAGRATTGEFANCLSIARGSLKELEALMEISLRLDFLSRASTTRLLPAIEEVSRMLTGLRRSIQRKR